jgi:hypothetical protein
MKSCSHSKSTQRVGCNLLIAHELIHVLHWLQGMHNADTDAEEWATIGLAQYATLRWNGVAFLKTNN